MRTAPVISTAPGTRREAFGPVEWGLLSAIALMWGSSFVFIEWGLQGLQPGLVAFLRIALGAASVAVIPRARRPVAREDWPRIALLGAIWMAIPLTLFPVAQQWITSSLAGMINGGMPLFAGLFAAILLRRMPRPVQVAGLLVGFAGVVLLTSPGTREGSAALLGAVLVLFATMLYGLSANLTVPLQQRYGALPIVLRAQLSAVVLLLPVGLLSLRGSTLDASSLASTAVLGVFGSGMAFLAMATLVGRAGATRGAVAIYFLPVVATILGVMLLDEQVDPLQLVGMGLVLAGAWLTSRRER
ncbi:MAG TPA: DMT family transporter [Actinomycetota bacterium]|nr:DMT family transporter [Actinomycetota bacterium]